MKGKAMMEWIPSHNLGIFFLIIGPRSLYNVMTFSQSIEMSFLLILTLIYENNQIQNSHSEYPLLGPPDFAILPLRQKQSPWPNWQVMFVAYQALLIFAPKE